MFVSQKASCDLCVFSPSELHIERVWYDPDFSASNPAKDAAVLMQLCIATLIIS